MHWCSFLNDIVARTLRSLRWDYARTVVVVVAQVVYTGIMARLLDPETFGLFALGLAIVGFGRYIAHSGVAAALIQRKGVNRDDVRATFTASIVLGVGVAMLTYALAPLAASFFGVPDLRQVMRLLALNFVIVGVSNTAEALLHRELSFRAVAIAEIIAYLVGYFGVGIVLAASGFGVWSLVASVLAQSTITGVLCYVATRHTLRPTLRPSSYRRMLSFSSWASLAGFVEYAFQNLDTLFIGRTLTPGNLGIYNRSSMLIRIPIHHMSFGLVRVMFPAFSRMQHDPGAFRSTYYRGIAIAASVLFPVGAGVAIAASAIVEVALGSRWLEAIPVLAVLAFVAPLHMLTEITASSMGALGHMRTRTILQSGSLLVLLGAFVAATPYGLMGVTIALLVTECARQVLFATWAARRLRPSRTELWRAYVLPVATAALTAIAVGVIDVLLLTAGVSSILRLLGDVGAGAVGLVAALYYGPLRYLRGDIVPKIRYRVGRE